MFLRNNLIDEVRSSINFGHSKKKKNATFKKQKKQKYSGISEAIGQNLNLNFKTNDSYSIKTFFRSSSENQFSLYERPTVELKL